MSDDARLQQNPPPPTSRQQWEAAVLAADAAPTLGALKTWRQAVKALAVLTEQRPANKESDNERA